MKSEKRKDESCTIKADTAKREKRSIIKNEGGENDGKEIQQRTQRRDMQNDTGRRDKTHGDSGTVWSESKHAIPVGGRIPNIWKRSVRRKRISAERGSETEEIGKRKRAIANGGRNTKKSSGILCERKGERIRFAKDRLGEYDTREVCRIIGVSTSGYYKERKQSESEKTAEENAVIHCFEKNKANYGRIRIRKALQREGINVSENRISKILKRNGLEAKSGRKSKKRKTRKPTEEQYIAENLVYNKFEITGINELWCADICELRCKSGKVYVSGIIDVGTRRIVGWHIARHERQEIVQKALLMAIGRNPERPAGAIYHGDRGSQYTAKRTKEILERNNMKISMSRPGTPHDNQPIESFWKTFELEMPDIRHLEFGRAKREIVSYIEMYYNSDRLHSGIGYRIPNEVL